MGFCSNCGSQIQDGTVFCSNCGAKTGVQPVVNTQGTPNNQVNNYGAFNQGSKPNNNKLIGMIAVGAAALIVLFIVIKLFGATSTPGYEKPFKYLTEGAEKGHVKTMQKAFPEYIADDVEGFLGGNGDDADKLIKGILKDRFGKKIKVSYKIEDKEKLDKDEIDDLEEDIEDYYDEKVKIKEAYEIEAEFKIKGSEDKDDFTDSYTVIKVGSKWYITENVVRLLYNRMWR